MSTHPIDSKTSLYIGQWSALSSTERANFSSLLASCHFTAPNPEYLAVLFNAATHEQLFGFTYTMGKKEGQEYVEIWDVCTPPAYRARGFATNALAKFIEVMSPKYYIWLGVREIAPARLYIKLGFIDPHLTNKSLKGVVYPIGFVSLTYNATATNDQKSEALKLTKQLLARDNRLFVSDVHSLDKKHDVYIGGADKWTDPTGLLAHFKKCGLTITSDTNILLVVDRQTKAYKFSLIFDGGKGQKKDFIEIRGVCSNDYSDADLERRAIKYFLKLYARYVIWVYTQSFEIARAYISVGFVKPRLTRTSPLGVQLTETNVSFIYDPHASSALRKDSEGIARELFKIRDFNPNVKTIAMNVSVYNEILVRDVMVDDYEIGGSLIPDSKGVLVLDRIKGTTKFNHNVGPKGQYVIPYIYAPFHYHTHPVRGSHDYGLAVGSPSQPDFRLGLHHGPTVEFVFSIEGVHTLEYTHEFMTVFNFFLAYNRPIADEIERVWIDEFVGNQEFRLFSSLGVGMLPPTSGGLSALYWDRSFSKKVEDAAERYCADINRVTIYDVMAKTGQPVCMAAYQKLFDNKRIRVCRLNFISRYLIEQTLKTSREEVEIQVEI